MVGSWILINAASAEIQHDPLVSNTTPIDRRLLTIREAAEALAIGRSHAYDLVLKGQIESVVVGVRCRRVPVTAIDDYVRKLSTQGAPRGGA